MRVLFLVLLLVGCNVDTTGQSFLGAKYISSPLGEGIAPDTDPLFRTDAFDCTTFVETVLSGGDVNKLNKIRYKDGVVDFLNRNHFIESDWLINNSDLVENVSYKYATTDVRHVKIDKANWLKVVHNIDADFDVADVALEYIPYDNLHYFDTDNVLIVLFVADKPKIRDIIGTDLAVYHMGLLLPGGVFRHASSDKQMVTDVDFYEYVAQQKQNKTNLGIVLVGIK